MSRHAGGFKSWLLQRVSAVYIGLFTLYLLVRLIGLPPENYLQWKAWFLSTPMLIGFLLFILFILVHAWIGIRDVLIDYVHPTGLRLTLLSLLGIFLMACGFWTVIILLTALSV